MPNIDLGPCADAADVFRRIADEPGAFWLDGGDDERPAVLGFSPTDRLSIGDDGRVKVAGPSGRGHLPDDPLRAAEAFVARATAPPPGGVVAAAGAAAPLVIGFLSYDLGPLVEPAMGRSRRVPDGMPLVWLARHDAVLVCRSAARSRGACRVAAVGADRAAVERLARRFAALDGVGAPPAARPGAGTLAGTPLPAVRAVNLREAPDRDDYVAAVRRAQEYVAAGDVYQVNLARRFVVESQARPADVYLAMRAAQPVPRGCFLAGDGYAVVSSSPETFLRVRGASIETEPIKGTRRRGADPAADAALRADLVADAKERAEHVMIVDLERNDLGRVCTAGSVSVPSLMRVESYATLHHMVSTVRGRLRDEVGLADVLRATFPGGSITGAPKIRASQVIAELEPVARGLYTGAIAWFRGPRHLDSSIAIRTAVARGGTLEYHVGAGIVADSDPEREYEECWLKARPFLEAAGVASSAAAGRRDVASGAPADAGRAGDATTGTAGIGA